MYAQGLATLALCEAYGMTRDEHVGAAARKAVAFIDRAQNPSTGGWRYYPGEPGDTSVTGWQVMALKSAQLAGIAGGFIRVRQRQKMVPFGGQGRTLGLYSYQPYDQVTPTRTAIGMLCTQYLGIDPKAPSMLEGKQYLLENLPDDQINAEHVLLVLCHAGHAQFRRSGMGRLEPQNAPRTHPKSGERRLRHRQLGSARAHTSTSGAKKAAG